MSNYLSCQVGDVLIAKRDYPNGIPINKGDKVILVGQSNIMNSLYVTVPYNAHDGRDWGYWNVDVENSIWEKFK